MHTLLCTPGYVSLDRRDKDDTHTFSESTEFPPSVHKIAQRRRYVRVLLDQTGKNIDAKRVVISAKIISIVSSNWIVLNSNRWRVGCAQL